MKSIILLLLIGSLAHAGAPRKARMANAIILAITAGENMSEGKGVAIHTDGEYYLSGTNSDTWDAITLQDLLSGESGYAVYEGIAGVTFAGAVDPGDRIFVDLTSGDLTTSDSGKVAFVGYVLATSGAGESMQLMVVNAQQSVQFHDFGPRTYVIGNNHMWSDALVNGATNSLYSKALFPVGTKPISGQPRLRVYFSSDVGDLTKNFDYGVVLRYIDPFGFSSSDSFIGTVAQPGTAYELKALDFALSGYTEMFRHWTNMTLEITRFGGSGPDTATGIMLILGAEVVY